MKKTHDNYMTRMKAFMQLAIEGNYPRVIRELAVILMHLTNANFWHPITYSDFELSRLSRIPKGSLPYARRYLVKKGFMTVERKNNKCCYTLLNYDKNDLGNSYATIRQPLGENGEEWLPDALSQSQNASSIHQYCNTSHDDNFDAVAQSTASVVGNGAKKDYDSWIEELPEKQRRTLQSFTDKMSDKQYKTVKQKYAKYAYNKNCPYAYMLKIVRQIADGSPDAAQGQAGDEALAAKHAQSDARILEEARKIAAKNGLPDPLTRLDNQTLTIPAAANDDTLSLSAACDLPDSINAQAVIEHAPATSLKPDSNGLVYSSAQHRAEQNSKRVYTCAEAAKLGKDLPIGAVITTEPSKEEIAEGLRKFMDAKYEAQCNAPDDDADETISAETVNETCAEAVSKEMTVEQRVQRYQKACAAAEKYGLPVPELWECSLSTEDVAINLDESISAEAVEIIDADETISAKTDETISAEAVETISAETVETISAKTVETISAKTVETISAETVETISAKTVETISAKTDETISAEAVEIIDAEETISAEPVNETCAEPVNETCAKAVEIIDADETISEDDDSAQIENDKRRAMILCDTYGVNSNCVDGIAEVIRDRRNRRNRRESAQVKPAAKSELVDLGIDENLINGYVQASQNVTLPDEPTWDQLRAMKVTAAMKVALKYHQTICDLLNLPKETTEFKVMSYGNVHDAKLRRVLLQQQRELCDKHKAEDLFLHNLEKAVFHALGRKTWLELTDLREMSRAEVDEMRENTPEKRSKRLAELKERAAYRAKNVFTFKHIHEQDRRLIINKDTATLFYSGGHVQQYTASEMWDYLDYRGWDEIFTLEQVKPLEGDKS